MYQARFPLVSIDPSAAKCLDSDKCVYNCSVCNSGVQRFAVRMRMEDVSLIRPVQKVYRIKKAGNGQIKIWVCQVRRYNWMILLDKSVDPF